MEKPLHKLLIISVIIKFFWLSSESSFAAGKTGFGIQIIDVTGFTLSNKVSEKKAMTFALGWRKSGETVHLTGSGHYLYIWPGHLKIGDEAMDGYVGPGLKFNTSGPGAEIRVAAGVSWLLLNNSLELYGEFIPGMEVYPETKLSVSMALGARYYF